MGAAKCPKCGGSGNEETGATNEDGDAITVACTGCGGSGQIVGPDGPEG